MQRHRHQEFIRFLNTIEAAVPCGKLIHAIADTQKPEGPLVARPTSALDPPLHAHFRIVASKASSPS
jgi:hypothetical protein